ncbi:TOMM precursor leader peptide-binding protein [Micromonospora sp. PLK6-60]|uniref:TOMM precursor leader peptide-binding protein n=1 Tax=Micromonospora sp. PLK6-60 TaxID=2873383 RepID=UPI001CA67A94|nr:TOMM precursor leader peptide-binding protein [Micromonospora sp. PLK6-60]MBY8872561.1 TOMM precursor leader peptide-binding protein [Micromonospora sp. PLK6-60]
MIVDVRTTSTGWDTSLKQLGEALHQRLHDPARRPAGQGARPTGVTVRLGALGLTDASREPADLPHGGVLPIWLHGATALVGPLWSGAGPDATRPGPCPLCVQRRWQAIRVREERHALEHAAAVGVAGPLPHLTSFAVDAIWALLLLACAPADTRPGIGRLHQLRMDTLDTTVVEVLADSECPACAVVPPDTAERAVIELTSRPKPDPTTYRLRSAGQLDLPVAALANPVAGALGGNALRAYNANSTAPVTGYFRVRSRYDLHEMWWSGHANSYGTSETYALLEGLERYAGQFPRARCTEVFDSYANLGPDAMDPAGLGYHPAFYHGHGLYYSPYSPTEPMHWVWGYSLRDRRPRLVPEQLVYYLDRREKQRKFVQECSNGCASGSSPEEALLHGMLELVERDAFLLAWYGSSRLAEIDPATCRDEKVHFMLDRVGLLGYDIRLFDTRADLPVPVVTAVAVKRDGGLGQLCFAAGASLDPDDAVRAAVCETASYVPGFDERVEASLPELREMTRDYTKVTELSHHALLYGLPEMTRHAAFLFDDPPKQSIDDRYADWLAVRPTHDDLTADTEYLAGLIAGLGGDVLAVDQTCPEQEIAGVHTMALVAPALIPIDFGWQRQRVLHSQRLARHLARGRQGPDRLGATARNPHPHPFP